MGFHQLTRIFLIFKSGTYTLNLIDSNSCVYNETFLVEALVPGCTDSNASNYNPLANIDDSSCCYILLNQNDTTICQGENVFLDLNLSSSSYLWSTGETSASIIVSPNISSFYWVLTDNNCYNSITIFVNTVSNSSFSAIACDYYTWDGVIYTSSGQYTNSYFDINGCDSLVTLDLTINTSDTTSIQDTACDTYTWLGTTYTTSGVYDSLFTNSSGCDSIVVLDLTIYPSIYIAF